MDDFSAPFTADFDLVGVLRAMIVSRECDRREGILVRRGEGLFQLSSAGHEGLAALAALLSPSDLVFSHYRDRALMLALGTPLAAISDLFFGVATSPGEGRQLPSHFCDRERGVWSALSPVAHNLLPACGAAWAMSQRGEDGIALAMVGDASCRQGEFYEAICFATEHQLPVGFVIEDNHLGISTPTDHNHALALGILNPSKVICVDARDPVTLFNTARPQFEKARRGEGPFILWCDLDRLDSHSNFDDQRGYLPQSSISEKLKRDPIDRYVQDLRSDERLSGEALTSMRQAVAEEVRKSYETSRAQAAPSPIKALSQRTRTSGPSSDAKAVCDLLPRPAAWTMTEAVSSVLSQILASEKNHFVFGQDVEDPKGGVFGLTRGLSTIYPGRVRNAPLAEATIAGVASGLAVGGRRPIVELQFIDFAGPAWSQIANNLSTLRWRSGGSWTCPVVIYAPCGGYIAGGGMWHSQSLEAAFCSLPGLNVIMPSSPSDAAGAFAAAAFADDPTLILLPKGLLRISEPVPEDIQPLRLGEATIRQAGHDITLVTWGNTVTIAKEAARLAGDAASVEIIDLRSLTPWDRQTVRESVQRTGRLLVIQEDNLTCGLGHTVLSEISVQKDLWSALKCPPRVLGRPDVHIGFHPAYTDAYLPQPRAVADCLLAMIEDTRS